MKAPVMQLAVLAIAPGEATRVPILIVDDDERKRFALRAVLAPLGYLIIEADSGIAALRCVMEQDFAVILMDVRMPSMNGFETATLLRQREQSELTPIIFITGYGSESEANVTAYDAGAADFIYSPVPPTQLRAKVAMFASLYLRAEFLAAQAREVQESADQLTLLTDAAPVGIFRIDDSLNYAYVNQRWVEITGIPAGDAIGRCWDIVMTPEQSVEFQTATMPGGGVTLPILHRFELGRGTGDGRIVHAAAKPILGIDGVTVGWVGTLSDVTEEVAAKAEMAAARDAALAANVMQSNFTASASHELKTPTASILGFLEEVLDGDEISDADRKFLDIAYRNAGRLSKLIDDLLVLGEEDIGSATMRSEPVEVAPLVEFVVSSLSPAAHSAGIELVAELPSSADQVLVLADPSRLEQALMNLASNALKFTPHGGTVRLRVDADRESVRIAVVDTGIGIDPGAIDRIFDRFYRAKGATDGGIKGSGLGLAIAQRMVEAQGGLLTATSVLGEGSTFTMTLAAAVRAEAT